MPMKVLILGANGATARLVTERLLNETDNDLVLFLRHADRLSQYAHEERITLVEGDAQNISTLKAAMKDVDIVYSNLGGTDLADSTRAVLTAMKATSRTRLLFYSALGALHEVPGAFGEWNEQAIKDYLPGFRESDSLISHTPEITTTQFRPAWLTDNDEVNYETTARNEPFKGTEVSRKSVADFVVRLIKNPTLYANDSIGLDKPGTDGDKPAWL